MSSRSGSRSSCSPTRASTPLRSAAARSPPARIRDALAGARVVWLDVEVDVPGSGSARAAPRARWPATRSASSSSTQQRRPLYEELADVIVPGSRARRSRRSPRSRVCRRAGTRPLGDHPVRRLPGLRRSGLVTEHRFWPRTVGGRRVVISDYNAGRHYGELFNPALANIRIIPGEQSKTVAHAEIIWTEMVRAGVTRTDVAVALGGGVIGDIAGFCAATYQRGMRVVQVPTTLVAQVDSAYGGKTGVDLAEAKNYVGAFHQPSAVIADTATLATLPQEELAAGYAEVVKTGLITGGVLWEQISGGAQPNDPDVIAAARWPSCGSSPRTSTTPACVSCSTSDTRSATRSRPRPATRATATAKPSASACWPRCACRAPTSCGMRCWNCSTHVGLPLTLDGGRPRAGHLRDRPRQEACGGGPGAVRPLPRRRACRSSARSCLRPSCARRSRSST